MACFFSRESFKLAPWAISTWMSTVYITIMSCQRLVTLEKTQFQSQSLFQIDLSYMLFKFCFLGWFGSIPEHKVWHLDMSSTNIPMSSLGPQNLWLKQRSSHSALAYKTRNRLWRNFILSSIFPHITHHCIYLMNIYTHFPDNQRLKEVFVEATGLSFPGYGGRHVMILWNNGDYRQVDGKTNPVYQLVQLSQYSDSSYYFTSFEPCCRSANSTDLNYRVSLGFFTRAQRDRIIKLAEQVRFRHNLRVNGCRVWLQDLLVLMGNDGMVSNETFDQLDRDVPLVIRQREIWI